LERSCNLFAQAKTSSIQGSWPAVVGVGLLAV
jgi:hypothetical protein